MTIYSICTPDDGWDCHPKHVKPLRRIKTQLLHLVGLISLTLSQIYNHIHVNYPSFWSYFNEIWIFSPDFQKTLNIKFNENPPHWEPSCSTRTDRQAEMTKPRVAFHNFANAPKTVAWFPISSFFTPPRWVVYANSAKPMSIQRKPSCLSGLCCKAGSNVH